MSEYLECHRPTEQERIVDGVCINPKRRDDFNCTKHDVRPEQELSDWWGLPYVIEASYQHSDDSYQEYVTRITTVGAKLGHEVMEQEDWTIMREDNYKTFLASYPLGNAYTVRCLDGGCHDRSSNKGIYTTLNDALAFTKALIDR